MDNFTIAVLIGGASVIVVFVLLMIVDKRQGTASNGPVKPTGK